MLEPSVESLLLAVISGRDPELSLEYAALEVACEYTLGSGEIAVFAVFGNIKGVYSSDVADGRRLCCVCILSAEYWRLCWLYSGE